MTLCKPARTDVTDPVATSQTKKPGRSDEEPARRCPRGCHAKACMETSPGDCSHTTEAPWGVDVDDGLMGSLGRCHKQTPWAQPTARQVPSIGRHANAAVCAPFCKSWLKVPAGIRGVGNDVWIWPRYGILLEKSKIWSASVVSTTPMSGRLGCHANGGGWEGKIGVVRVVAVFPSLEYACLR